MDKITKYIILSILPVLGFIACETDNAAPDVPVYTYNEAIVNPPDSFKLAYNLRTVINYQASIRFQEDAVWKIEKLNSFTARFWISRPDTSGSLLISNSKIVGLKGDQEYHFFANNNNSKEDRKLYILFTRQSENYDTFENKF